MLKDICVYSPWNCNAFSQPSFHMEDIRNNQGSSTPSFRQRTCDGVLLIDAEGEQGQATGRWQRDESGTDLNIHRFITK